MDHQVLFEFLPFEIVVDIISRLPIRTILICKCVCKSWLELLQSPGFVQYHLSKSLPNIVLQTECSQTCDIYESVNLVPILQNHEFLDLRIIDPPEFKHLRLFERIQYPFPKIKGSLDGLLIICHDVLHIVNPTTREYIKIDSSELAELVSGFGVSRKTVEYKVIRIFVDKFEVYTLGTGSWRIIISNIPPRVHHLEYISHSFGAFLNGNLHWLAYDSNDRVWISCFDLEYEHFSIFASPPLPRRPRSEHILCLSALDGCLWFCDSSCDDEVVIWVLKDYGDEKSWRKKWVFRDLEDKKHLMYGYNKHCWRDDPFRSHSGRGLFVPIKVSECGDNLFAWTAYSILHCSRRSDGGVCVYRDEYDVAMNMVLHTSSFLSLKSFPNEKVISFKDLNDC